MHPVFRTAASRRRVVLGALALLAMAVAPASADKCTAAKLKAIGKKESGLLSCQAKLAATGDSSGLSACETKIKSKFSAAFGKAGTCAGDQTTCENIADTCEATVAAAMTDTLPSKCEGAKRKAAGKLTKGELGCYGKAAAKGVALDAECIMAAQSKLATALGKAGTCPDGGSPQSLVETNCVAFAVTTDGGGMVTSICGQAAPGTTTTTLGGSTTTTSSTSTTTTSLLPCTAEGSQCGCGSGVCVRHCGVTGTPLVCVDNNPTGICTSDSDCPSATPTCVSLVGAHCTNNSCAPSCP